MPKLMIKLLRIVFLVVFASVSFYSSGKETSSNGHDSEEFSAVDMIMHHISDSHYWHIVSYTDNEGQSKDISLPLPVILYYQGSVHLFLSSAFHHGESIVQKGNHHFRLYHEKIYLTDANGKLIMDDEGHPTNAKPLDLSITRNVASMWLSIFILIAVFVSMARQYKGIPKVPRGLQSFMEPIVLFVRDDIVIDQIGEKKADRYMPFLLTLFFFIWINNLIGLMPIFPGGSNLSGNISFTFILATITFLITNISGTKGYWKHIVWMPGVPVPIRLLLSIIEFIGLFTKPFALMIRLFANITAGHIIILSLMSLIFVLKSIYIAPVSVLLGLVMFMLELLVAVLQAYIFTLLSALFIGMAVHDEEH
jgi:F-type H+-transporting ATPase subunit a